MFLETEFSATPVQLEAGDTLFLYTDGLSEASNESSEYGVDRVMTLVHQHAARQPAELIDACLDDVRAFTNGAPNFDDMTVLAPSALRLSGFVPRCRLWVVMVNCWGDVAVGVPSKIGR